VRVRYALRGEPSKALSQPRPIPLAQAIHFTTRLPVSWRKLVIDACQRVGVSYSVFEALPFQPSLVDVLAKSRTRLRMFLEILETDIVPYPMRRSIIWMIARHVQTIDPREIPFVICKCGPSRRKQYVRGTWHDTKLAVTYDVLGCYRLADDDLWRVETS